MLVPGAGEGMWEAVRDAAHIGKFFVSTHRFRIGRAGLVNVFVRRVNLILVRRAQKRGRGGPEQGLEAIRNALDLLHLAIIDHSKLQDAAVGGGEEGVRVGRERADAGLEGPVEEGGKVRIGMQVWLRYLCETVPKTVS